MEFPTALTERYHITSHLARGGMADVYEGQDTLLNRRVAIKVLHSQFSADEAFVKRFRREAQAAANLSHPNVVGIYDWGQVGETYFIVMELVDGRSLRDVLRSEGALLPRRATEIATEVAAALSVAHQAGLVHRDVKPGNILLAKDGTVKVTDFGIARAWDDSQELTRTGAVIGTATYFSPEQAQGAAADARSDLYSLGVVLYEMLSGRPPFTGDSPMSVAFQHVSTEAPPPSALNGDVGPALDQVVTRAMRKDPSARYQSAAEMRSDLLAVMRGEPVAALAALPGNGTGEHATRVMATPVPPVTVPPDEVYRGLEEEPPSQMPFILTAFALLVALGVLVFFLFRLASGEGGIGEMVAVPNVFELSQEEGQLRLEADGFEVTTEFEESDTVPPGRVIRTDPEGGSEAPSGSEVTMYVSTGAADFPVPPLIGKTLQDAEDLLDAAGLEVGTITPRPDPDFPEGTVLDQNPGAGVRVASGTPVNLVVSSGPELVVMPDLVGFTERDAVSRLQDVGLKSTVNDEYSDTVPEGMVIRTNPAKDAELKTGDTVLLVVSLGPEPVDVPELSGMTKAQAEAALANVGLKINVSATKQTVADPAQHDRVVAQFPSAGTELRRGDTVNVTLGEYVEQTTTTTSSTTTTSTTVGGGGGGGGND